MMKKYANNLKDAIRIVTSTAKDYNQILVNHNYIFIYRNRDTNQIEFFESIFLSRNFQHLTGIEFIDSSGNIICNSTYFYQKCVNSTLKESEIQFKKDGTTELKLQALPLIINFLKSSKMTAIYNGVRPKLSVDRLAGTTNFSLGFTKDSSYYVPSSCLLEDIRNLSDVSYQILAIFSKPADKLFPVYRDIHYVAKGIPLNRLNFPDELKRKISLENYIEK